MDGIFCVGYFPIACRLNVLKYLFILSLDEGHRMFKAVALMDCTCVCICVGMHGLHVQNSMCMFFLSAMLVCTSSCVVKGKLCLSH